MISRKRDALFFSMDTRQANKSKPCLHDKCMHADHPYLQAASGKFGYGDYLNIASPGTISLSVTWGETVIDY